MQDGLVTYGFQIDDFLGFKKTFVQNSMSRQSGNSAPTSATIPMVSIVCQFRIPCGISKSFPQNYDNNLGLGNDSGEADDKNGVDAVDFDALLEQELLSGQAGDTYDVT